MRSASGTSYAWTCTMTYICQIHIFFVLLAASSTTEFQCKCSTQEPHMSFGGDAAVLAIYIYIYTRSNGRKFEVCRPRLNTMTSVTLALSLALAFSNNTFHDCKRFKRTVEGSAIQYAFTVVHSSSSHKSTIPQLSEILVILYIMKSFGIPRVFLQMLIIHDNRVLLDQTGQINWFI